MVCDAKAYEECMKSINPLKYGNKKYNRKTGRWERRAQIKAERRTNKNSKKTWGIPQSKYQELRGIIFARDLYKCQDCGKEEKLHVHHIIHKSDGGTNDPNNLVTLCKWCHAERHKGENVYNIMAKGL